MKLTRHRGKDLPTAAERITKGIGSWVFLGTQTGFLSAYVVVNLGLFAWARVRPFDPFPFVFLNLMLSFQAAYTGPVVLMAQVAQSRRDQRIWKKILRLERDTQMILKSVDADQEATQELIVALPTTIRTIVREELERYNRQAHNARNAAVKRGEDIGG